MNETNKKSRTIIILSAIAVLSVFCMVVCLSIGHAWRQGKFVPPEFEPTAQSGTPDVPKGLAWQEVWQPGMTFRASICARVEVKDGKADIYLTNSEQNNVLLKLKIMNSADEKIAETGVLKSGEYVQSVSFEKIPENGEQIVMKLMAYEPTNYYSAGSVKISTPVEIFN